MKSSSEPELSLASRIMRLVRDERLENGKFLLKFYLIKSVVPFWYIYV